MPIYTAVWYDATAVSVFEEADHETAIEKFRDDADSSSSAGAKLFFICEISKPADGLPWRDTLIASVGDGEFMDHLHHVNLWGSRPDEENDDCHTGTAFLTLEEAQEVLVRPWEHFDPKYYQRCTAYFELVSDGKREMHANPDFVEEEDDDSDWQREQAMQAGMGLGVEAYNDAMGCDLESPEED